MIRLRAYLSTHHQHNIYRLQITNHRLEITDLLISELFIVSVFIHWKAKDKQKIYDYNYEVIKLAIKRSTEKEPSVEEALARKESAKHPFA